MNNSIIQFKDLRPAPNNRNFTIPKSYGVWEVALNGNTKKYRYGNNPVREEELSREFDKVTRVAFYLTREDAISHAKKLNDDT